MKAKRIDRREDEPPQQNKIEPQLHHTHDLPVAYDDVLHEAITDNGSSEQVATQGGAYIRRDVNTAGGIFVGRDYIVTLAAAPVDLVAVRARYLEWVIAQYQYWDVSGLPLFNHVPPLQLEEVYLPLSIEPLKSPKPPINPLVNPPANPPDKLARKLRYQEKQMVQRGTKPALRSKRRRSVEHSAPPTLSPFDPRPDEQQVWGCTRLALLGPPGAGKTTLLRFLTLRFAKTLYQTMEQTTDQTMEQTMDQTIEQNSLSGADIAPMVRDREGNMYGAARLPIFVRLDQFAAAVAQEPALSLRAFLVQQHADIGQSQEEMAALFQQALEHGEALLLFDGLDTIQDASVRRAIAQRVEQFVSGAPSNHFIIASRVHLYRSISCFGSFEHFTLAPMTQVQMVSLLWRQKRAMQTYLHGKAPTSTPSQGMTKQDTNKAGKPNHVVAAQLQRWLANPGLRQLATNPLMLTLMMLVEDAGERLPERRFAFYELAVKTLLERWEEGRGAPGAQQIKEHELLRLLGPLAYWMQTYKPTGVASEVEVKSVLTVAFAGWLERSAESREIADAVETFFQRLCLQEGIFVERASRQYCFAYTAFQEYLVAHELVRRSAYGIQQIQRHRQHPQWQEPILLAVANLSRNLPLEAGELIRLALYKNC